MSMTETSTLGLAASAAAAASCGVALNSEIVNGSRFGVYGICWELIGVKDGPPAEEVALMQAIGFTDAYDIKYNWLASKLRTPEEVEQFYEDVLSLTMPTEAGQVEAREMFQSAVARGAGGMAGPGAVAEPAGGATAEEVER